MSVEERTSMSVQHYVPFRGADRAEGAVGTVNVDIQATGDGSGGTVKVVLDMSRVTFGFHALWVPTRVSSEDNIGAVEVVQLSWQRFGNERLAGTVTENVLTVRHGVENAAPFGELGLLIEPDLEVEAGVMQMLWQTNTDTKTYHLHAFGPVYDGEFMSRGRSGIPELLAGLR